MTKFATEHQYISFACRQTLIFASFFAL